MKELRENYQGITVGLRLLLLLHCIGLLFFFTNCKAAGQSGLESAEEDWRAGNCRKAESEYESYLQKKSAGSQFAKIHFDLGNVYSLCQEKTQRDLNKALEHYRLAYQQASDTALGISARQRVAEIFVDTNRRYEAIGEY